MLKNGKDATRGIIDRRDAMNSLYQKALPLAKQSIYNLIPKGYNLSNWRVHLFKICNILKLKALTLNPLVNLIYHSGRRSGLIISNDFSHCSVYMHWSYKLI